MKDFAENYLKPAMFAELSSSMQSVCFEDIDIRGAANNVGSDRGTAAKQLRRYFDLFSAEHPVLPARAIAFVDRTRTWTR